MRSGKIIVSGFDVGKREAAAKSAHLYVIERIAGFRHKAVFKSFFCPDKGDFRGFIMILDGVGDGDGGIDVAAGAAARKKNFHEIGILSDDKLLSCFSLSPEEKREIESIIPISASCMTRAVPP